MRDFNSSIVAVLGQGYDASKLSEADFTLEQRMTALQPGLALAPPIHRDLQSDEVLHACAGITKGRTLFGYEPPHWIAEELDTAAARYLYSL